MVAVFVITGPDADAADVAVPHPPLDAAGPARPVATSPHRPATRD
ncbi:hypothetical protein GCM10027160_31780 [Streptomyces calidiresistens]|nr:hypothetical protein [Streptomyces calidiresistens]